MGSIINKLLLLPNDNLETFSLIWVDASIYSSEDNIKVQQELRTAITQLISFDDAEKCAQHIENAAQDDRIVLIVSGSVGKYLVPKIHNYEQLVSIYVYCSNKETNEKWSSRFTKVKAVVTEYKELILRIQNDHEKRKESRIYDSLPISIFDSNITHEKLTTDLKGQFVHSQLLINYLLRVPSGDSNKKELILISRQIYKNNKNELKIIDEFEKSYDARTAISWYTRDSFLFRLLNKALRTQNIEVLFLFHFFIHDIRQQLQHYRCRSSIKVYQCQLMSIEAVKKLQDSKGKFISINSFLSATRDLKKAMSYLENTNDLQRVLFKIDADAQSNSDKPFADIKSISYKHEDEILFMLGSIFQIISVYEQGEGIYVIQLKLCCDSNKQIDSILDDNELFAFGHVLLTMGKIGEAEIYFQRLLSNWEQLKHKDLARCYETLGTIADDKSDDSDSLRLYQNAIDINKKTLGDNHPNVASNLISIGNIYRRQGDFTNALQYYEQAKKNLERNSKHKIRTQEASYNNSMGALYQEQQKYQEALSCFQRAHHLCKTYLSSDQTMLGMSFNNLGNVYYLLHQNDKALEYYEEALRIYKQNLPPSHKKFASTYNNLGGIYEEERKYEDALYYFKKAAEIYRTLYSTSHPDVEKIEANIRRVSSMIKR